MLTDEQVYEVSEFFKGDAWAVLFATVQSRCIHKWLGSESPEDREECWREMQAVMTLHEALKSAPGIKELDLRGQHRRYQA